ncbi:MAG: hypothetical protein SGI97_04635 [candidate division Zixibacteria bacterium]|nr:hypothetical protein [candidate division Zixibacteria bacterium]
MTSASERELSLGKIHSLTRIALFSALVYVLAYATAYAINVKLTFFIVFTAGFVWGVFSGMLVGVIGTGLWSFLNPYGPVNLPVMLAQMGGMALSGAIGALYRQTSFWKMSAATKILSLVITALISTLAFYIPVNIVDAAINQPFWPWFYTGMLWSGPSLLSNALIFPLLFGATLHLYKRETSRS